MTIEPRKTESDKVKIIGECKILYAAVLAATALGAFHFLNRDIGDMVEHFVSHLHLDPENHLLRAVLNAAGMGRSKLEIIAAGTVVFSALEFVEGIGLYMERRWGHYLTVISTCILMLPEAYEIAKHVSIVRITVLLINLAVAIYLVYKLKHDRPGSKAKADYALRVKR